MRLWRRRRLWGERLILRLIRGTSPPTVDSLKTNICKMCCVFLHREHDSAIVATMFKDGGVYFESSEAITTCVTEPGDAFGAVVRDAFISSKLQKDATRSANRSKTDWPVFQASGARTVAQFERDWVCVSVTGLNEANIAVRLETEPLSGGVTLGKTCNPLVVEQLGGDIRLLRKLYLKWERS